MFKQCGFFQKIGKAEGNNTYLKMQSLFILHRIGLSYKLQHNFQQINCSLEKTTESLADVKINKINIVCTRLSSAEPWLLRCRNG